MRAMLLAAGRGERLRPYTDTVPKALLPVRGQPLIVHRLQVLRRAGIVEVVINLGWLGAQIRACLGDGTDFGMRIDYSDEGAETLETAGGIVRALPLLGTAPFLVINADLDCDFDPAGWCSSGLADRDLGRLLLVANPPHHPGGDFALIDGRIRCEGGPRLTFAGVGLYRPELFAGLAAVRSPLGPLLRSAAAADRLAGERHCGRWRDVGTVERWQAADQAHG